MLLPAPHALAQTTTADITGSVDDASGASIPNATVTLTNLDTKEIRTAQTSGAGDYTFAQLGPGNYSIEVKQNGFKTFVVSSVALSAGDRLREDAKLEVGSAGETVQVTSQTPALQTDSSNLSSTVTEQAVQDLPLNGRNYINLTQITPGANEGPPNGLTSGGRPDDRRQTSAVSINGQSEVLNNELLDGLDNNERIIGGIGIRPSIESIREINVQSNNYTAEVGRAAAGVINIITKSGSNSFHGSAYEFFRNDALDATPYQFGANNRKPELRQNQFGGSLGGPIIKDKVFFFGDYEGLRSITGGNPSVFQTVTQTQYNALHSGDPAQIAAIAHTTPGQIDPVGLLYAQLYPAPTTAGSTANTGGYTASPTVTRNSDVYDGRVDWQISQKDLIYGRYSYNTVPSNFPGALPIVNEAGLNIAPGGADYNFYGAANDGAQNAQINYVRTFSSSYLLQLGFGYTRINNQSTPLNYGLAVNQAFGQPNVNLDQVTSGLAPIGINGLSDLGDGSFIPIIDIDNTFQENGVLNINKGAHNIKVGGALIRRQATNVQNNQGIGNWGFNPITNPATGTPDPTGLPALLQGFYNSVSRSNSLQAPHYRVWEPSGFIQDDWHAASNLTLNIGVRYELFTPFSEVHNAISNFDPATASIVVANQNGVNSHAGLSTTYTNVAPRIGFALTAAPGLVVRGGFGISNFPQNYTSNSSLKNQPFVSNFNINSNDSAPVNPGPGNGPGRGADQFQLGIPLPSPASATNPTGNIADTVDPAFRSSYIEQFNLTVEKAFGANVLQASYVGLLGRYLAQIYNDQNIPGPISNQTLHTLAAQNGLSDGDQFNHLRPFYTQLPNVTQIGGYNSRGSSSYNALQLSITRRTTAGLTLNANYTLAHGLDNVLGISNEINDGYGNIPSIISSLDYGNSDLDIRNRGVFTGNYELPFGKNLKGVAAQFGKGWQANTLLVWETGLPFTVTNSQNILQTNAANHPDRPNLVRRNGVVNPQYSGAIGHVNFFDPSAFQPQESGTFGSENKNPFYGPNYRHLDFSLFKSFPVYRESTLEFRAESFNLTNLTNFANPNAGLQVSPNPQNPADPNSPPSNTYAVAGNSLGQITGTSVNYNPRQIQFALKYQF